MDAFDLPIARMSFESLAPVIGDEARRFMKHTAKYTNETLGHLQIIEDFLPTPADLVLKDDGVKITISLSKRSVAFFKDQARKSKVPYQKMIRNLLDVYANRYSEEARTNPVGGKRQG